MLDTQGPVLFKVQDATRMAHTPKPPTHCFKGSPSQSSVRAFLEPRTDKSRFVGEVPTAEIQETSKDIDPKEDSARCAQVAICFAQIGWAKGYLSTAAQTSAGNKRRSKVGGPAQFSPDPGHAVVFLCFPQFCELNQKQLQLGTCFFHIRLSVLSLPHRPGNGEG